MRNRKSGAKPRMTFGLRQLLVFGGIVLCLRPSPAVADVLFSDLKTPPDVYGDFGRAIGSGLEWASLFAVTGDANVSYAVSQVDLALSYVSGTNSFFVYIAADEDGEPGVAIANSRFTLGGTTGACCAALVTLADIQNPILLTGQGEYFIVVAAANNAQGKWFENDAGVDGAYVLASMNDGVDWSSPGAPGEFTLPAFDVIGSAVPEPSSRILLGTVAVLLWVALGQTRSTTAMP
jgi:hypothetical protein